MTIGTGSPAEGADAVAGAGSTKTTGSAAAAEAHDAGSGVGATPGGAAAAIAEGHDTVAGAATALPPGGAGAAEGHDAASGAGSTPGGGSAAIAEGHDTTSGAGAARAVGIAAVAEDSDSPSGTGGAAYLGWGTGSIVYPFPPDWSQDWSPPMTEILAWRTDVMRAAVTGTSYHNSQRIAPGRAFEFYAVDSGQAWRLVDQVLDSLGGGFLMLPIWPDGQLLTVPITAGDVSITCLTAGRDFTGPGWALLWTSPMQWIVIGVASVGSGVINLQLNCPSSLPAGTRLYPLRLARVADGGQEYVWGGNGGYRILHFDIYETCDWPAATLTMYQTHPVLEWRPNEDMADQPITGGYGRMLGVVDNSLGDPEVADMAGISLRGTAMEFYIQGRTAHTNFRGLLYALRGAASPIWVPTFKQDFLLVASALSSATTLTVEWSGYSVLNALYPNRKDIRIELMNGTVLYRRVTGVAVAGANEVLTIDSALGVAIQPSAVRAISLMRLSTMPDSVQIQHLTSGDGLAICTMTLSSVTPDV